MFAIGKIKFCVYYSFQEEENMYGVDISHSFATCTSLEENIVTVPDNPIHYPHSLRETDSLRESVC